jgi:hypothetical protein
MDVKYYGIVDFNQNIHEILKDLSKKYKKTLEELFTESFISIHSEKWCIDLKQEISQITRVCLSKSN